MVDRIGNVKVQDLNKLFEEDELVSYINQRMLDLSEHHLEEKDQIIWIIDLSGKIMQLASKKIIEQLGKVIYNLQTYFPDILYRYLTLHIGLSSLTRQCSSIRYGISCCPLFTRIRRKKY